jgi:hypothetical protein
MHSFELLTSPNPEAPEDLWERSHDNGHNEEQKDIE